MQSVEIKAIDNNDFDIWLPLWKGYQRFYEVDIPEFVTLKTWARFLDPVEPMHAALAMVGEQALGLVHSIYHRSAWDPSRCSTRNRSYCARGCIARRVIYVRAPSRG